MNWLNWINIIGGIIGILALVITISMNHVRSKDKDIKMSSKRQSKIDTTDDYTIKEILRTDRNKLIQYLIDPSSANGYLKFISQRTKESLQKFLEHGRGAELKDTHHINGGNVLYFRGLLYKPKSWIFYFHRSEFGIKLRIAPKVVAILPMSLYYLNTCELLGGNSYYGTIIYLGERAFSVIDLVDDGPGSVTISLAKTGISGLRYKRGFEDEKLSP